MDLMTAKRGGESPPQFVGPKSYIKQLKAYMKENDISYGALARALEHEDSSQVSRWMNERVEPRLSTIELISKAIQKILKERH